MYSVSMYPFAFQVFVDNFVHGDLHPGNILVQLREPNAGSTDSNDVTGELQGKTTLTDLWDTVVVSLRPEPCPLQLVLLDAGIVAQLSDHDLANFKAVFTAVVLRQVTRERVHPVVEVSVVNCVTCLVLWIESLHCMHADSSNGFISLQQPLCTLDMFLTIFFIKIFGKK